MTTRADDYLERGQDDILGGDIPMNAIEKRPSPRFFIFRRRMRRPGRTHLISCSRYWQRASWTTPSAMQY